MRTKGTAPASQSQTTFPHHPGQAIESGTEVCLKHLRSKQEMKWSKTENMLKESENTCKKTEKDV